MQRRGDPGRRRTSMLLGLGGSTQTCRKSQAGKPVPGTSTRASGRRSGNSCRDAMSGASPAASASLWQQQLRLPWAILRRRPMTVGSLTGPARPVLFPVGCVETETGDSQDRGARRACVPQRGGQERAGAGENEEWPGHKDTAVQNRDPQTAAASGRLQVREGAPRGCGVRWTSLGRLASRFGSNVPPGRASAENGHVPRPARIRWRSRVPGGPRAFALDSRDGSAFRPGEVGHAVPPRMAGRTQTGRASGGHRLRVAPFPGTVPPSGACGCNSGLPAARLASRVVQDNPILVRG